MPTQFKRVTENPLYTGHFIPLLGYWTEAEGWVKNQDLEYESEVLSCPIIAVVDTKIGKKDSVLTITGKQTKFLETRERVDGIYTLKKKIYEDAGTTIQSTLTVPRHTRPYGTFLITGLGQNIWGIQDVTTSVVNNIGKISFYALASAGSKIIYWMGIHFLAEELRNILRPWIAPSKCTRCGGTGIEPETSSTDCLQCLGYRFSGYSAIKLVQRKIGFDLGLAREILDWDNLTEDDHKIIRKFINKCWTQKWWVTPTINEIKRLFAHFYDVPLSDIRITERYNPQEPVWKLLLPFAGSLDSPFGALEFTESDADLMRFIAKSVTPAGVSVFVGFYRDFFMGDIEDFSDSLYIKPFEMPRSSLEPQFELHGMPRGDFYNGWTKATDHFERSTDLNPGHFPATYSFEDEIDGTQGTGIGFINSIEGDPTNAIIINSLDRHKKILKLTDTTDTNSYVNNFSSPQVNGTIEWWVLATEVSGLHLTHLSLFTDATACIQVGINNDKWRYYESGYHDIIGASKNRLYHLRIDFECGDGLYEGLAHDTFYIWIDETRYGAYDFNNVADNLNIVKLLMQPSQDYSSYYDAIGYSWDTNYEIGDNLLPTESWFTDGIVEIVNVNDMNRHMVKLTDNSYIDRFVSELSGSYELWVHPEESDFKIGMKNASNWMFYVEFDQNGFYDCNGVLITMVKPYNDYHLSIDFNHTLQEYSVRIMRETVATEISYLNPGPVSTFRIENYANGDAFIDAFGFTEDPSYNLNDNWQRLYEYGWGINNDYYITGITGDQIDVRNHYRNDRFWDLNDY